VSSTFPWSAWRTATPRSASSCTRTRRAAAFDRLDLHRVTASTNSGNEASARALLRLGFRQEGHLVQCVRFADAWHDELIFAMLASEWAGAPGRIVA
jgi:RimJ/RimL family protein N-acetyltransferase